MSLVHPEPTKENSHIAKPLRSCRYESDERNVRVICMLPVKPHKRIAIVEISILFRFSCAERFGKHLFFLPHLTVCLNPLHSILKKPICPNTANNLSVVQRGCLRITANPVVSIAV